MLDQESFLKKLAGLADYAGECGNVLTKAEVEGTFSGMELGEEQFDLIYRYLFEKKITIQGIRMENTAKEEPDFAPQWMQGKEEKENGSYDFMDASGGLWEENGDNRSEDRAVESGEDSRYLQIYLDELGRLPAVADRERLELAMRLLAGEKAVLDPLLEATLYEVVEIAREYQGRGVPLADLIQEGNIALMQVLREMSGKKHQEEPLRYIRESVQYEMEQYIDGQMATGDEEERVVAKLGLLHESAKYLAGENGELPSAEELAEFTRMSVQEVKELVRLSGDVDVISSRRTSDPENGR